MSYTIPTNLLPEGLDSVETIILLPVGNMVILKHQEGSGLISKLAPDVSGDWVAGQDEEFVIWDSEREQDIVVYVSETGNYTVELLDKKTGSSRELVLEMTESMLIWFTTRDLGFTEDEVYDKSEEDKSETE